MERSKGTVVVVDDEDLILESVSVLLRSRGFRVFVFRDGRSALQHLAEQPADLVLADLNMPQMNGFALMAHLRAAAPDTPVIIMTGGADLEVALSAVRLRAYELMLKPFQPLQLIRSIESGIREKRDLAQQRLSNQALLPAPLPGEGLHPAAGLPEESGVEIIRGLVRAAGLRDGETGQHVARIGDSARLLARGLGMPEAFCEMIAVAATLHDIGKIGIPDAILFKPDKLTPQEYEVVKGHTTIGQQILAGSSHPVLEMAASIALTHHERWDGTGYPVGLSGKDIPLVGRIVMIADQYDALRSRRAYKPSMDHATACGILLRGEGRTQPGHFDPAVLKVFMELAPTIEESFAQQSSAQRAPRPGLAAFPAGI